MSVLLQISDPHFGTEQPPVVEALVALASQLRANLVVLSGDITQRARPSQFLAAKAFVDRMDLPVLAIPGNRDRRRSVLPHQTVGLCAARSGLRVRECHHGAATSQLFVGPAHLRGCAVARPSLLRAADRRREPGPFGFPESALTGEMLLSRRHQRHSPTLARPVSPSRPLPPKAHHAQLSPQQS